MKACYGLLLGLMMAGTASALELVADRSSLSFISVKNGVVAELSEFKGISGSLDGNGELVLNIDLASLDTGIEKRDQRMREFLFDVAHFPVASVTSTLPMAGIESLAAGQELDLEVEGRLNLHGVIQPLTVSLRVVRLADGALRADTAQVILLQAEAFKLEGGIEKLRSLASLAGIDAVVPVYFSLVFQK